MTVCGMGLENFVVLWVWDSVEMPTGFSVGMEWVLGLKSNPDGSSAAYTVHAWL